MHRLDMCGLKGLWTSRELVGKQLMYKSAQEKDLNLETWGTAVNKQVGQQAVAGLPFWWLLSSWN